MKNIVLVFFLILSFNSVFARCSMSGMQFFPLQNEISLNSMFIVQGYAFSQETILSFKNTKVYLESKDGDLIELHLQEILVGQKLLTQAIFKPCQALDKNTTYFLKYEIKTEDDTIGLKKYRRAKRNRAAVYWNTTDKTHAENINPNLKIDFLETSVFPFGCGPSTNAIFEISNTIEKEVWYKTELVETETNKKTIFYLSESDAVVEVGHNMCAGAFTYANTSTYKVRFTPMNTDGKSLTTTDWITFDSPYLNSNSGY